MREDETQLLTSSVGLPSTAMRTASVVVDRLWRPAIVAGAVWGWGLAIWLSYQRWGLFWSLGVDWGLYWAQSMVLRADGPSHMYDLERMRGQLQALLPYTTDATQLLPGAVAYPPLFAWLHIIFTLPPPPIAFAAWTALNIVAAAWLAHRAAEYFPAQRLWVALLVITAFPVINSLTQGQPTLLLACAVGECFRDLRQGREFRAGLWLACLCLKPQYGVLLGLLLLVKRRWHAVGGAALGTGAILGASAVLVGPTSLVAYGKALLEMTAFGGSPATGITHPEMMANFRAFGVLLAPTLGVKRSMLLTLVLSAGVSVTALLLWRGRWVGDARYGSRMTLLLIATLLASYHNHLHGVSLLTVPLAAALAEDNLSVYTRGVLMSGLVLPVVFGLLSSVLPPTGLLTLRLFIVAMMLSFVALAIDTWIADRADRKRASHRQSDTVAVTTAVGV